MQKDVQKSCFTFAAWNLWRRYDVKATQGTSGEGDTNDEDPKDRAEEQPIVDNYTNTTHVPATPEATAPTPPVPSVGPALPAAAGSTDESATLSTKASAEIALARLNAFKKRAGGCRRNQNAASCPICYAHVTEFNPMITLDTCGHCCCKLCIVSYLKTEILDGRTDLKCLSCPTHISEREICYFLRPTPELREKYDYFMVRRCLALEPDVRWCPAPNCTYAVIAQNCATCPRIKCGRPGCGMEFCYHCKSKWHPQQKCNGYVEPIQVPGNGEDVLKLCPRCRVPISKIKDGTCNHITCSVCGCNFCWLCLREVTDMHFISASGCTFWGKTPWSRRKRILWQLAIGITAPVGIALLAGISIPAIMIGLPIFALKTLPKSYSNKPKLTRYAITTLGVAASITLAPLLAAFSIAVGVPVLFFYVYAAVPYSLYRQYRTAALFNQLDERSHQPNPIIRQAANRTSHKPKMQQNLPKVMSGAASH